MVVTETAGEAKAEREGNEVKKEMDKVEKSANEVGKVSLVSQTESLKRAVKE